MHPAFSVIFFTVASGAGYGLFILLAIAHVFGLGDVDAGTSLTAGILSLALITGGLMSSTFHLANPKNAWRAFFRFKTSWLSREGVFAVLFYPFAMLYLLLVWMGEGELSGFASLLALVGAIVGLVTVFSTGMIYGCLKTIRQWNTALTPANYILIGLATGGVLFVAVMMMRGQELGPMGGIVAALIVIAAIMKAIYYFWVKTVTGPTINTATGFTRASVRLLDVGHTAGTFLTDEFGYKVDPSLLKSLKVMVFALGFVLPLALVVSLAMGNAGAGVAMLAAILALLGAGMERWLFFAEARHVVNLFHGAQNT